MQEGRTRNASGNIFSENEIQDLFELFQRQRNMFFNRTIGNGKFFADLFVGKSMNPVQHKNFLPCGWKAV